MIETAFVFGLLGSVHCLGMCGPIAFVLPLNQQNNFKKAVQLTSYHLGRLMSYASIGACFGIVGKQVSMFGFQQYLSVFTGVIMILYVIFPALRFGRLHGVIWVQKFLLKIQNKLKLLLLRKENTNFLAIGILNGLLPCGFVYMAVFGSLAYSKSTLDGVLFMFWFGLGTVPLMSSVVYAYKLFSKNAQRAIQKHYPILVIIIGGLFILRGLGLDIPYLSPAPIDVISSEINCH